MAFTAVRSAWSAMVTPTSRSIPAVTAVAIRPLNVITAR